MSEPRFAALAAEVEANLAEIRALGGEIARLRPRLVAAQPDTLDLRAAGSILHDFYSGVERVLERLAVEVDGGAPTGADWHTTLLRRMALPIESVRPGAISAGTAAKLEDYLRFRHLFRNVYGGQLRWARMQSLVDDLPDTLRVVADELTLFTAWLRRLAAET